MSLSPTPRSRETLAWAFYDWANSAFVLLVVTAIYPIFFGSYWAKGLSSADTTFWLGLTASASSLVLALTAPILGAIADHCGRRKLALLAFVVLGVLATAGLGVLGVGAWGMALLLYFLGNLGFNGANTFYDSLLPSVSTEKNRHKVSALGFALGYAGSVLLLLGCFYLISNPSVLGYTDKTGPTKLSFVLTALWWAIFTMPLMLTVREPARDRISWRAACGLCRETFWADVRTVLKVPGMGWFFGAFWLYNDGINTIIRLAGKLASDLGFSTPDLMSAIVVVQVVGVPSALLFGWLGQRFGVRAMIIIGLAIYLGVTVYASAMTATPIHLAGVTLSPIMALAIMIGLVQGGVQSLSRSLFASMIPTGLEAASFGLYNVVGKAAAIVGPVLVGVVSKLTGSTQLGILVLAPFFLVGGILLLKSRVVESRLKIED